MILDNELIFSKKQAITATATSTNSINTGSAGVGAGRQLPVFLVVTEDFNNLDSLNVALQESSDDGDTDSFADVLSKSIGSADLVAGKELYLFDIPPGTEKYLRLNYTVSGSDPTNGALTSGIVLDEQTAS